MIENKYSKHNHKKCKIHKQIIINVWEIYRKNYNTSLISINKDIIWTSCWIERLNNTNIKVTPKLVEFNLIQV